jgi:hypothetical protein
MFLSKTKYLLPAVFRITPRGRDKEKHFSGKICPDEVPLEQSYETLLSV